MTDHEQRAQARERAAYMAGFDLGVQVAVEATDDLLTIAAEYASRLAWAAERLGEPERRPRAIELHCRINAAMAATRRVRASGAAESLVFHDLQRSMG